MAVMLGLGAGRASGAWRNWTGQGGGYAMSWYDAGNWLNNQRPQSYDDVCIDAGDNYAQFLYNNFTICNLRVDRAYGLFLYALWQNAGTRTLTFTKAPGFDAGPAITLTSNATSGAVLYGYDANNGFLKVSLADDTTMDVETTTGCLEIWAPISGTGALLKTGPGELLLASNTSNPNTYTGVTTVSGGMLRINDEARIGNGTSSLVLDGGELAVYFKPSISERSFGNSLTINSGGGTIGNGTPSGKTITFTDGVSGSGPLTIAGSGTVKFTGTSNAFAGSLNASAGTTDLSLAVTGSDLWTLTGISGGGTITRSAAGEKKNLIVNVSASASFGGTLAGNLALKKEGAGTLTLSGANSYAGTTTLSNGVLTLGADNVIPDSSAVVVNSSATGAFNLNGHSDTIGSLAGSGAVSLGAGTLTIGADGTSTTYSGAISGSGAVAKVGAGTLTLAGSATPGGTLTVSGGVLALGSSSSISTGASYVGGASGASVNQAGGTHSTAALTLGQDAGSSGTYSLSGDPATVTLTVTGNVTVGGSGAGTFNQSGGTHSIGGNLLVSAAGAATGAYTLSSGALSVGGDVRLDTRDYGSAAFTQTGGTHTVAGMLSIRGSATPVASYTLSAGTLTTGNAQSGGTLLYDHARFDHTGGTHAARALGVSGGAVEYNLSDEGILQVTTSSQISDATFNQSGGTHTFGSLWVGSYYNLSDGTAYSAEGSTEVASNGTFTQSNGTHDVGGLTIYGRYYLSSGTLNVRGNETLASGGRFIQTNGYHTVSGVLQVSDGVFDLVGSSISAGEMVIGGYSTLNVSGGGGSVNGNVTNYNNIKTWDCTFYVNGWFNNCGNYYSDPSDNHLRLIRNSKTGVIKGGVGDRFFVTEDFLSESIQTEEWDTREAELHFAGSNQHVMSVTGADFGATPEGFEDNFAWGSVHLASGEGLILVDGNDTPGGALYAGELVLADGLSQLGLIDSNGLTIYYDAGAGTQAYLDRKAWALSDGGMLVPVEGVVRVDRSTSAGAARASAAPVPEPALPGLLGCILCFSLARRSRAPGGRRNHRE